MATFQVIGYDHLPSLRNTSLPPTALHEALSHDGCKGFATKVAAMHWTESKIIGNPVRERPQTDTLATSKAYVYERTNTVQFFKCLQITLNNQVIYDVGKEDRIHLSTDYVWVPIPLWLSLSSLFRYTTAGRIVRADAFQSVLLVDMSPLYDK